MNHSKLSVALAVAAAGSLSLAPAASAKTTITMSGSTSIYPLVLQLGKAYNKKTKGAVGFRVLQGGSDVGVNDASRGRVSFGMSSRDPQSSDPDGLSFNKIARDGVCVVTHPDNALANVSRETVQSIFSGTIRNWKDVPGAQVTGPIDLVTRTPASGTADAFQNIFMGADLKVAGNASQKASNGLVQQSVASNKNAIAYLDFKFISGTSAAPYGGVPCNLRNAKSGQYLGVRNFWLVSRGKPTGDSLKFLRYVKSAAGQKIVSKEWVSYK